jgi:hypothetical protein
MAESRNGRVRMSDNPELFMNSSLILGSATFLAGTALGVLVANVPLASASHGGGDGVTVRYLEIVTGIGNPNAIFVSSGAGMCGQAGPERAQRRRRTMIEAASRMRERVRNAHATHSGCSVFGSTVGHESAGRGSALRSRPQKSISGTGSGSAGSKGGVWSRSSGCSGSAQASVAKATTRFRRRAFGARTPW